MRYAGTLNPHVMRTVPLYQPARRVFGYTAEQHAAFAAARAIELAGFQIEGAEAALVEARRRYVEDRAAIGLANKGVYRGFKRDPRTARKLAFIAFNRARSSLRKAELALVAKQAALAALTAPAATH